LQTCRELGSVSNFEDTLAALLRVDSSWTTSHA
jgi:hypothetical protein